ncbi:hypothetical protein BDW59DRAFT_18803 [Aspergillus cavernicola]|uniref:Uncharacterized protein n=1 Tax=Aspergillus cavernicola TaxID=176166 RepID=A0ABR4ITG4_9EURO
MACKTLDAILCPGVANAHMSDDPLHYDYEVTCVVFSFSLTFSQSSLVSVLRKQLATDHSHGSLYEGVQIQVEKVDSFVNLIRQSEAYAWRWEACLFLFLPLLSSESMLFLLMYLLVHLTGVLGSFQQCNG